MAGQEHKNPQKREDEPEDAPAPATAPEAAARKEALDDDIDSMLDEIDDVLETNAEDFVTGFRAKRGANERHSWMHLKNAQMQRDRNHHRVRKNSAVRIGLAYYCKECFRGIAQEQLSPRRAREPGRRVRESPIAAPPQAQVVSGLRGSTGRRRFRGNRASRDGLSSYCKQHQQARIDESRRRCTAALGTIT